MATTAPFPVNPELTAVSIRFRNPALSLIADEVCPRVPVYTKEFKYQKQATGEAFTLPDTQVGRRGRPAQVEFNGTETAALAKDYGLEAGVPQDDIDQAAATGAPSPLPRAAEGVTDLILLDRERRVSNLYFTAANYAAGLKATLAGASQWSDDTSDPVEAHLQALDLMLIRATIAVYGRSVWTQLSTHPKVVAKVFGSANSKGIVTRQAFADALELKAVHVGESWINTAKKGQPASMGRAWGKHAALLHINPIADNNQGLTFAFTGQYGTRIAGSTPDKDIGLRGGQMVRVGETLGEVIAAQELGYFFENAIA